MWAMSVRRLKRMHARIEIHRALAKLDLLEIVVAAEMDPNDIQRLQNRLLRVIDPMAGKRIIKV